MEKIGKILINVKSPKESYHLLDNTEVYYSKLRLAYQDILNDKVNDYLYFAFVTLCSATLEYSLNYILVHYCVKKFGPESYKSYCEQYIKISFARKLMMLPHIISDGKLMMNILNKSYLMLTELITLRNRLLHNKTFLGKLSIPIEMDLTDGGIIIEESDAVIDISINVESEAIDKLNKVQCLAFGIALGEFKKLIMDLALLDKLESNEMIESNRYSSVSAP